MLAPVLMAADLRHPGQYQRVATTFDSCIEHTDELPAYPAFMWQVGGLRTSGRSGCTWLSCRAVEGSGSLV